jgi:hypothetical protein
MSESAETTCPGCGVVLPLRVGLPSHPYLGASPACWASFGELIAREYEDPDYFRVHQLTVDTYAVQHPGERERRAVQSVAVHLMTLGMVIEYGLDPRHGPQLHKRMVKAGGYQWLAPRSMVGRMTVLDVLQATTADEHERFVRAWAEDVWEAWAAHHPTVRLWIERSLG